jgi:DNA-directed RNA polymerase specialized sigma24 family protein
MSDNNHGSMWEAKSVDPDVEEVVLEKVAFQEALSVVPDPLSRAIVSLTVDNWTVWDIANLLVLPINEVNVRFSEAKSQLRRAWRMI